MARMIAVTAALGLLAPAALAAVPMPPVTAELPAPDAVPTRVAFTQGAAGLVQAAYSIGSAGGVEQLTNPDVEPVPGSEGAREFSTTYVVSSAAQSASSWVSAEGDVYVRYDQNDPIPITCDAEVSHPVVSPDGFQVAYAVRSAGETWRIEVAEIGSPPCAGGEPWTVPRGSGDDLWPAWLATGNTGMAWDLAFSSTRDDPLGDIYVVTTGVADAEPLRITYDMGADVQPSAVALPLEQALIPAIAFATTRYRPDGSIALMYLAAPSPFEWEDSTEDPWATTGFTPQGSEPLVTVTEGGFEASSILSFTSTEDDPYGDILVGDLSFDLVEGQFDATAGSTYSVLDERGVAESHPAWLDPPSGEPSGAPEDEPDTVLTATANVVPNDIGEADAATGDGLRTAPGSTDSDDGGPAYSPDGAWIVFSTAVQTPTGIGRQLMLAATAGGPAVPLSYEWDPGEGDFEGDWLPPSIDVDPAWSPDGSTIAFERRYDYGEGFSSEILLTPFVPDGPPGALTQVTNSSLGEEYGQPAWSPDGTALAAIGISYSAFAPTSEDTLTLIDLTDPSAPVLTPVGFQEDGCGLDVCSPQAISGRAPAWSPDGTQIALADAWLPMFSYESAEPFDYRGGVGILTLDPDDRTAPIDTFAPLVGFYGPDEPTDSRHVLATATDPAWSVDGSEVYVAGQAAGVADDWGIYAVTSDGSEVREVAQEPGPEIEPTVQPDVDLSLTMTASPNVIPVGGTSELTVTVRNEGPRPVGGYRVLLEVPAELQFGTPPAGCTLDDQILTCLPTAPLGPLGVSILRIPVVARVPGTTAEVTAVVLPGGPERVAENNAAATTITVTGTVADDRTTDLAVTVTASPTTGYVGGRPLIVRITVTNNGPAAISGATVTTAYPAGFVPSLLTISSTTPEDVGSPIDLTDPDTIACLIGSGSCLIGPLLVGDSVVLEASLLPVGPAGVGDVTATVALPGAAGQVDVVPGNDAAAATLTLLQPEIRLLPSVARPGDAVLAYGENFPPGQAVTLTWSQGITADPGPYVVTAEGRLVVPLVLVTRDLLGDRDVIATSPAGAFGEVRGPLLVVPQSIQAPNFLFRG